MRGSRSAFAKPSAAILAAVFLAFAWFSHLVPTTVRGLQCPTSPIQTITVAQRDCCGRVVGYQTRKPREGERGFKQCQCTVKRAAAQDGSFDTGVGFPMVEPPCLLLRWPLRLADAPVAPSPAVGLLTLARPPAVRPPLA